MTVHVADEGPVRVVTIDRPERRNAIDTETARALEAAFGDFDSSDDLAVAVLTGAGGTFCAGADLKAMTERDPLEPTGWDPDGGSAPLGPTWRTLAKPVIAAVEGYAVAGGLELACWCDLRVAARDAVFGVFCRRWDVPLIDGGTIRLPRIVGHGRALDMILTGRAVAGEEAYAIGLVNRLVGPGETLAVAVELARDLSSLSQHALRSDRLSSYEQFGMEMPAALANELRRGLATIRAVGTESAARFAAGEGRGGAPT
jgi:enoyl-CoA hydratase